MNKIIKSTIAIASFSLLSFSASAVDNEKMRPMTDLLDAYTALDLDTIYSSGPSYKTATAASFKFGGTAATASPYWVDAGKRAMVKKTYVFSDYTPTAHLRSETFHMIRHAKV